MILPLQIRAARALLNISQMQLADLAEVSIITVKRLEGSRNGLRGTVRTYAGIQKALEQAGVEFIPQDDQKGPGVRLKSRLD